MSTCIHLTTYTCTEFSAVQSAIERLLGRETPWVETGSELHCTPNARRWANTWRMRGASTGCDGFTRDVEIALTSKIERAVDGAAPGVGTNMSIFSKAGGVLAVVIDVRTES
jgi:hypothetical protein